MQKAYRKKGRMLAVLLLIVFAFQMALFGCGKKEESAYHIEYLNKEKTHINSVAYEPKATETDELIREFLAVLSSEADDVDYRKPIPNDVEVTKYSLDGALLTLWFDADYNKMNVVEEVLCRAAIVRTLTQIKGVDCVAFYIGDAPLTDTKGNLIGSMNADSFVENPGEQINSIQNTNLTLYFANENGDGLVKEVREDVYYSSNISMEKLIMEQLLEGPSIAGAKSAIPSGTKLVTISVVDGVCYVSLDEAFKNQDYKVNEAIVIYSIVNSLSEIPTISKVQISVNGDTSGVYRDSFKMEQMYERNLDYVVGKSQTEAESEIETEMETETELLIEIEIGTEEKTEGE